MLAIDVDQPLGPQHVDIGCRGAQQDILLDGTQGGLTSFDPTLGAGQRSIHAPSRP